MALHPQLTRAAGIKHLWQKDMSLETISAVQLLHIQTEVHHNALHYFLIGR